MVYIYILELENNKYYVGKTNNIDVRIEEHFNNNGASWTKKYKPIRILEIIPDCDNFDEDKYVLKMMNEKGICNVRGGSFVTIKLSDENINLINRILEYSNDKCSICGSSEHFAINCSSKKTINNIKKDGKCDCVSSLWSPHRISKCFIKNIAKIFDDEGEDVEKIKSLCCYRCGRQGHFIRNCYARTNIKGESI